MSDYAGTKGEQSGMVQVLSVLSMILLCFVLMLAQLFDACGVRGFGETHTSGSAKL